MKPIKRILVATDFSETSDHALAYAIEFARSLHAAIVLVHSYELPIYGFPDGSVIATADMATRISNAAQTGLDSVAKNHAASGVEITRVVRNGAPAEEVNAVADEVDADVIVIGTHGRRGLARALLGSVAERIIRTATRPVLTIRTPTPRAA
jgi:nucleotide-binding universal stress UspA family protein